MTRARTPPNQLLKTERGFHQAFPDPAQHTRALLENIRQASASVGASARASTGGGKQTDEIITLNGGVRARHRAAIGLRRLTVELARPFHDGRPRSLSGRRGRALLSRSSILAPLACTGSRASLNRALGMTL